MRETTPTVDPRMGALRFTLVVRGLDRPDRAR
jgi:hypothetical protein